MISREPIDLTGLQQAFPYPRSASGATTDLGRLIIAEIESSGPLAFSEFMARCLYHPKLGYYARPEVPVVSKTGDFITSVSVGPVFGKILAHRLHRFWLANGTPANFTILEPGTHDGSLALDILDAIHELAPDFAKTITYLVHEPLRSRQEFLKKKLGKRVTILSDLKEAKADIGALIANEILDALPVPLFLKSAGQWHEVFVTAVNQELVWTTEPTEPDLPKNLPDGYVTEGPPNLASFLTPLANIFNQALFLWIDYGLDAETLYHPARSAGTLRCYRGQQTKTHPLDHPGEQDLTADVNFTAVEEACKKLDFTPFPVMNQSRYLTHCAREWLLESPSPQEISQFQTLTHPSQFGSRFYALELTKGPVDRAFP